MAVPIFIFVVEGFVRRSDRKRGQPPFDSYHEGFAHAGEARARFDALVEHAKSVADDSPIQRVTLRRHRIDGDQPLALLAAALVTRHLVNDSPPWAASSKVVARYRERPTGDQS